MPTKRKIKKPNKSSFRYATPASVTILILLGLLLWLPLTGIGVILGLIWLFHYSKGNPKLRLLWWILVTIFIAREILVLVIEIRRYY